MPTENLRDNEWVKEFHTWNLEHLLPQVEFMCIQSAYKLAGHHWDIVVVDEVHTTLSTVYRNFYENNLWERMYCFTATPPENQEYFTYLHEHAPIIKVTNLNEARKLGIVSPYTVYNLGVSFTPEEALEYNRVDKILQECTDELGGPFNAFKNAGKFMKSSNHPKKKISIIYYKMMNKRKQMCFNAFSKLVMVKKLTDKFPDRRTLIFSESIEFAEQIQTVINGSSGTDCSVFHSKMHKKDRKDVLECFGDEDGVRVLEHGFTSYFLYNTLQISGPETTALEYLINTRRVGNNWKVNRFRDMAALAVDTSPYYMSTNVNAVGTANVGTVTTSSTNPMFIYVGVIKYPNPAYLNMAKDWTLQKKFIDKWIGIRLIYDNQSNNLLNLYSTTVESRIMTR